MPIKFDIPQPIVQYHQNIFFLLNTCDRMAGELIHEANSAMHEVIPDLQQIIAKEVTDPTFFKLCCMEFDTDVRWTACTGLNINDIAWIDAKTSYGTCLGQAYLMLNSALSRRDCGLMQAHHNYVPIIILLLGATPCDNVEPSLEILKKNRWFQHSIKIAIEVDHDPHPVFHQYLLDFTMNENAIIHADGTNLRKTLKNIMIQSVQGIPHQYHYINNINTIKPEEPNDNNSHDDIWDDFDF